MDRLEQRPESSIVVVSHCVFLHALMNRTLQCDADCDSDWFQPGELRTFYLQFDSATQA